MMSLTTPGHLRWDPTAALAYVGGDRQLLSELLSIFDADSPALVETLTHAMTRADHSEFARVAHMLKGELRTLGAITSASRAERLEQLGMAGCLDDAPELLACLRRELTALREEIAGGEWR
jgi:two-component system, sensor histidine kinase and response regulator